MNLAVLKAEITNDPMALGYAGKTAEQICDLLNAKTRSKHVELLQPTQILNSVVYAEWTSKTVTQQQTIWNLLGMGALNPWGIEATIFTAVFGAGSATIMALAALRVQAINRAEELELETVYAGHINEARAYGG